MSEYKKTREELQAQGFFEIGKKYEKNKDYEKALEFYELAANLGDAEALSKIGHLYFEGTVVKYDYEKALYYFTRAAEKGNEEARFHIIWHKYINDENIDYKELFGLKSQENQLDKHFNKIKKQIDNNSPVITIKSIMDLLKERPKTLNEIISSILKYLCSLPKNTIINIKNGISYNFICSEFYSVSDIKKIIKVCHEYLKDIDLNQNEKDILSQIYIKLGISISYRKNTSIIYQKENDLASKNLMILINQEGECLGYALSLKFLLDIVGIESIVIISKKNGENTSHAYNQIKIDDEWYFCDITNDSDKIKNKQTPRYCLNSRSNFEDSLHHQANNYSEEHETSKNYPDVKSLFDENYSKMFNKNLKAYLEHLFIQNSNNSKRR